MKKRYTLLAISLILVLLFVSACDLAGSLDATNQLHTFKESQSTEKKDEANLPSNDNEDVPGEEVNESEGEANAEDDAEESKPERTEPQAADFIVYDAEGNQVKLSDFIGKPIVLNFWASWCGPCQHEMPAFQQKYLEHGNEVQFLMINLTGGRETVNTATTFINGKGYTFPVYFDTSYSASNAYNVYSIPTTYFIDADGYIIANAIGAISAQTLQQGIDMIK